MSEVTGKISKSSAKYLQLCNRLKDDIENGVYPGGSKLPPCRELTKLLGASYVTINNAVRKLEDDGFVLRQHGKGIYVKSRIRNKAENTVKIGYMVDVKVSIFSHFFVELLDGLKRQAYYNIPVNMPAASVETTLEENEKWLEEVFLNHFDRLVILGDRHFPFKSLTRYRNEFKQINFIFIDDTNMAYPAANRILIDFEEAGYLAARRFLETGHRKLAILSVSKLNDIYRRQMGLIEHDHSQILLDGMERAYGESGEDFYSNVRIVNDVSSKLDEERCMSDLRACFEHGYTAFYAFGDTRARKIYSLAEELGLEVGNDISVIGFYDLPWCEMSAPKLTSISVNEVEIGRLTAQAIKENWSGRTVLVKPSLHIRQSG